MRIFLHIDLGDLGRVGRDPPPFGMVFIDLALKTRRIDAQNADAQSLVFGDVLLEPARRDVRASLLEQLAVVVRVERVDEAELADRHPMRGRRGPGLRIHPRQRVAATDRFLDPGGNLDLAKRLAYQTAAWR